MTIRTAILLTTALIALFAPLPVQLVCYAFTLGFVVVMAVLRVGYRLSHPRHRRYCR